MISTDVNVGDLIYDASNDEFANVVNVCDNVVMLASDTGTFTSIPVMSRSCSKAFRFSHYYQVDGRNDPNIQHYLADYKIRN